MPQISNFLELRRRNRNTELPELLFHETKLHVFWSRGSEFFWEKNRTFVVTLEVLQNGNMNGLGCVNSMKNMGALIFNAKVVNVFNILITLLIRCICKAREHIAKNGGIRRRITDRDNSGIQGGYLIYKQKIAKTLSSEKQTKASRCLTNAVSEQQGSKR